ncbi:MAG: hypothetical protein PVG39_31500 [Desulfobacteraceae bacterium]|jgi:hypothetical protein
MAFDTEDIRKDFWRKTTKYRGIPRDIVDIKDPQGKKFLETQIHGVNNYVRIDDGKGNPVIRRRKVTA